MMPRWARVGGLWALSLALSACADEEDDGPVGDASAFATRHGFSFANDGNAGIVNLTPVEVHKACC